METEPTVLTGWRAEAAAEFSRLRKDILREKDEAQAAVQAANNLLRDAMNRLAELDKKMIALDIPVIVSQEAKESDPDDTLGESVSARDVVLAALREVYPSALRSDDVRRLIESHLGRPVHYKTPGMTLYRLSQEGLVQRHGRSWYALMPKEEEEAADGVFG